MSQNREQPVAVVVVEDDPRTRSMICDAIRAERSLVLAAQFDRFAPARAWLREGRFDVLLTDLGLPDGSGIDLIRACTAEHPQADIMVITMFGDDTSVLASIEAGATGYILKGADDLALMQAIRDLRAGGSPMSPLIARKVLTRIRQQAPDDASDKTGAAQHAAAGHSGAQPERLAHGTTLTRRESETLDLIARGYTYEETARLMSVSVSTVQTHIRGIYSKLAVNSRSQAVLEAHKRGLLMPGLFRS